MPGVMANLWFRNGKSIGEVTSFFFFFFSGRRCHHLLHRKKRKRIASTLLNHFG
jgi:hypothetical protein